MTLEHHLQCIRIPQGLGEAARLGSPVGVATASFPPLAGQARRGPTSQLGGSVVTVSTLLAMFVGWILLPAACGDAGAEGFPRHLTFNGAFISPGAMNVAKAPGIPDPQDRHYRTPMASPDDRVDEPA